uniref:HTH CENPB-type domain-containing protein n=1 Tax=Callorhinchus milii TaxID=7868 RepID=A0A4W3J6G9_CALMI
MQLDVKYLLNLTRTYQEKYQILQFCEANPEMTKKDVASKFGLKPQTLNDYLKNKKKIYHSVENPDARKRIVKRTKHITFEDVDAALILWFRQKSSLPEMKIDGEMLRQKADYFARELGHEGRVSMGWIDRFKKRWGIVMIRKAGESAEVNLQVLQEWKDEKVKYILERYKAKDIYNADETALCWQILPETSLGFAGDSHHGAPHVTLLVGTNMDGSDKLPVYIIGKSMCPRAFRQIPRLPLEYSTNSKAWMTSVLFEGWLKKLDGRIGQEKRKIAMILDNCSAHSSVELDNIELVFLPPNASSVTQPMDGGIIRNLKFHYRRILATRRLNAAEHVTPFKWELLDAMFAIKTAWSRVSQATISNCFKKAGFEVTPNQYTEDDSEQETQRQFQNVWDHLTEIHGKLMPSLDDYVDVDVVDTETTQELTDQDIVSIVSDKADVDCPREEGSETQDSTPSVPTIREAYHALDVLRRFSLTVDAQTDEILELVNKAEAVVMREVPKRTQQKTNPKYFQAE